MKKSDGKKLGGVLAVAAAVVGPVVKVILDKKK